MMRADIAVVGAGILGCLIAREIAARAPRTSVALLDRDAVGAGTSRRSAGLHLPRGGTDRVRRMSGYSQDFYARLGKDEPAAPIRAVDMVVVAADSASRVATDYLPSAALTRVDGVPGDLVDVPGQATVWHGQGSHHADVYLLCQALARRVPPSVHRREGTRVDAVDITADSVVLRLGTGDTLTAGQVVLAPGPWLAAPAWRDLVAPLGARVKKVVALHVGQAPTDDDPVIVFEDEDAFLLPLPDKGYWLYSYTNRDWDADPDRMLGLSRRDVDAARRSLRRYAPALAGHLVSGRVFCDAYSGTGEPRVAALDGDRRVVFAGAANGSGYRLAPAIASEALDLLYL